MTRRACLPWCPQCYANMRGRSNYKGHRGYHMSRNDKAVSIMTILRKAVPSNTDWQDGGFWPAPDGCELMPALREFLLMDRWPEGDSRATGTVILFQDSGLVKCLLNDKAQGRIAVVSARTAFAALEAAEEALALDCADWRADRGAAGRRASK